MTRPRRALLLLALLSVLLAAGWHRAPVLVQGMLERELSAFFNREVTVGSVDLAMFPLEMQLRELRIAGPAPGAPPFVHVRRATVVPSLRRLWEQGSVSLWLVVLEAPTVRIRTFKPTGDDLPKLRAGSGGGPEVHIRRLVVEEGLLDLDEQKTPFRVDLPGLRGRLSTPPDGGLAGNVQLGPGPIRFGSAPPMDLHADVDLRLKGRELFVDAARLRSAATDLRASGRFIVKPLSGQLAVSGPVDLALADRHVLKTTFGLAGAGRYEGTARLEKGRFSFTGRLEGTGGTFDGEAVPRYAGRVSYGPEGTTLRDFAVSALGGDGVLQVDVPPAPQRARVQGQLKAVDAEALARYVFDWGELGLAASATGPLDVSWPRGEPRLISGHAELDLQPRADGRTPLEGAVRWSSREGHQELERAELRTPHTAVTVTGRVGPRREADLDVAGQSRDLAAADRLSVRLRRAVGATRAEVAGTGGHGSFAGHWGGTLDEPVFRGRLSARDFAYLGVTWGELDWTGVVTRDELRSEPALLARGAGRLRIDGSSFTGDRPADDHVDIAARFERWPAADFRVALESDLEVEGELTGTARVTGTALEPWGTSEVTAASGRYYGVPFEDLHVETDLLGPVTRVTAGRVKVGGGAVRFSGTVNLDEEYDGEASGEDVGLEALAAALGPSPSWAGRVSGRGRLRGTLAAPRLEAELRSERVFFGDEGVGALEARLTGDGDGRVGIDARLRSGRLDVELAGRVGAVAPYVVDLRVRARETSLDPYLRSAMPALPDALGVVASGELLVQGPAQDPARMLARVDVQSLSLQFPGYRIVNPDPVQVHLQDGRVRLDHLRFAGEGTDLEVHGSAGVDPASEVTLALEGSADLRALAALVPGLRGRGAARLHLDVSGSAADPRLAGTVDLEGAGVRARGFPHGIEGLRGQLRFSERGARIAGVTGTIGGGEVSLSGQASWSTAGLQSFDVRATGRSLGLRYPAGLRSVVDGELRLFGDATRRWLTGDVEVRQASWTQRYDLASELLATRDALATTERVGDGTLLDVRLRAPGTLRVDNNLATLQARADLSLRGTSDAPVVIGRAEVERGRVYFQGTTYVIRRGTIDFANPQRTDPVFDIEAEARVRSYRVTLDVSGTLERVHPTLSSDPPLSPVQIVSLLAGADEDTVASLTQGTLASTGTAPGARLAASGAATLAAGRLSEEVGLERGAERLFGLNRFSIDPSLVRGGMQNPSARVTVGKRVTPDLNVLYSVDLRGTEERLLTLEYTVSDRVSVLLTREDPGGFGFDLRLRQSR